ncbi:unnamed protein product [Sphagnum jensenii]|uniref:Integrase zinc-binding domain-containing protein n=1 Tax=Sphagnum jensenii TaxID=128206 RepID=A0ABP1ALI4_9BRYO
MDDEDFQQEIQDDPHMQPEVAEAIEKVLATRYDRVEAADHENLVDDQSTQGLWKDRVRKGCYLMELLGKNARGPGRATHYYWKEQKLFFKDLYVPRPEERRILVVQMHEDLGHSGEQRLLVEICRRCGVQASTIFSPFMVLTGRSPRLKADNYLSALTDVVNDEVEVEQIASQFLEKKPGKKRALAASWEGPYQFIGHVDGKGNYDFEEGSRLCIVQDADGRQWERSRRDLQIYYMPPD